MNFSQHKINESAKAAIASQVSGIDRRIDMLEAQMSNRASVYGDLDENAYNEIQSLNDKKIGLTEKAFSIGSDSTDKKLSKDEEKQKIADMRVSYDRKYNGFCLATSGYDIDKLESMLTRKKIELKAAKAEKHNAKGKYEKAAAEEEIDYLTKVCHRCGEMIRKKKRNKF